MILKSVRTITLSIICISLIANTLIAQTLTVRNAHSMTYDPNGNRVLLFGGADEKQVYGDLWELAYNGWKLIKTENDPGSRTFASFVYDEKNGRAILFGGNKVLFGSDKNPAQFYDETWEFKNDNWNKLDTENSPEARAEAAIAYDEKLKRIILFGGYNLENGKLKRLNDTWELKGNTWRKLNKNEISARNGAALAYDSKLKKIVLFGG
jgi:N-acetylneuraminic acid mutarotase